VFDIMYKKWYGESVFNINIMYEKEPFDVRLYCTKIGMITRCSTYLYEKWYGESMFDVIYEK
jgi:hypothetical protein